MRRRRSHRSRAPIIAMADMFICVSALFIFFLGKPDELQAQQEAQRKAMRAEVSALEERVGQLRADRDEAEQAILDAAEEKKRSLAAIQGDIEVERQHLEQRKKEYADWDIVVQTFTHYAGLSREPDYHFYLRASGTYSSAAKGKWSKGNLKTWLQDVARQTPAGSTTDIVFYAENGANDQLIFVRHTVDEINASGMKITEHDVILPPGVAAGPDEIIHVSQGGGK